MKKLILSVGIGLIAGSVSAQVVNSTLIHVNEGAVLSLGSSVVNNGEISNNGKVILKGDLTNNAKISSKGDMVFNGNSTQEINGSEKLEVSRISVENDINIKSSVKVNESINFQRGIVTTEDAVLSLGENAKYTGASDISHVAGSMQKSGVGSFDFPVGDGSTLRSFEVKNLKGNTVEAKYVARNPMDVSTELDYNMEEINQTEYWVLSTANNADLDVKLSDNSDVAYLKGGVWVKSKKGFNASNGVSFTSGKGKNIVPEIGVWPNPTYGEFNLKLTGMRDTDNITVEIVNLDGRKVMSMEGTVQQLRKAYSLPKGLVTTNLTIRVVNGEEAMTQNLILHR